MNDWIISILIVSVLVFLTVRFSTLIEHRTGRSAAKPNLAYLATLTVGTGLMVFAVNAMVDLPLAYTACVAGFSASIFALLGQYLFGKPISKQ